MKMRGSAERVRDNNNQKRVCIIGAGVSGLPSIKACLEEGHLPVCYEKTHDMGGLWNYRNLGPGEGTVMRTTVVNTSKEMMSFSDYPAPAHWPNYFHNTFLNKYLHDYASHFGLDKHIEFGVAVHTVKQAPDYPETGAYLVKTSKSDAFERFDAVMVCTGHHSTPFYGSINGLDRFTGETLHAQSYHEPEPFANKRVLLVGFGNSALDIAVDLASVAKQVYVSTRRGAWIWNRLEFRGLPFDTHWLTFCVNDFLRLWPEGESDAYIESIVNMKLEHDLFGVRPQHHFFEQHPTLNDHMQAYMASGQIIIKDDISDINGSSVTFTNGSQVDDIDVIVLCTGYTFGYPFIEPADLLPVDKNDISLYKTVFPPDLPHPTLAVIGLIQPYGAIQPIAELQTRWFAQLLSGNVTLPSCERMRDVVLQDKQAMHKRFYDTQRHTVQVDYMDIAERLADEIGVRCNKLRLLWRDPVLAAQLYLGPNYPTAYRLVGPHAWDKARPTIMSARGRVTRPLASNGRHVDTQGMQHGLSLRSPGTALLCVLLLLLAAAYLGLAYCTSAATTCLAGAAATGLVALAAFYTQIRYHWHWVFEINHRLLYLLLPSRTPFEPRQKWHM